MNKTVFMAVALAGTFSAASAADITGKVTLKGTPPPEEPQELNQDCGKLHTTPVMSRRYVVGKDAGLANVFVYVKEGVKGKFDAPKTPVLIDQKDCVYEPYVSGAMVGQTINVQNSDPFLHNVHPTPRVDGNKEENVAQVSKGQVNPFKFDKQEVLLRFKCDVHIWMTSFIGVVEHPFFAVTDKDGNFKIANLPPGEYTLEAYHLSTHKGNPGVTQKLTVKADDKTGKADFTVELK